MPFSFLPRKLTSLGADVTCVYFLGTVAVVGTALALVSISTEEYRSDIN
jgi:hypothetical protein